MNLFVISFFTAIGYFIIMYKMLGKEKLVKTQVLWDIVFTLGLPILFIGTFSGLATAVMAGVLFSIFTSLLPKS